VLGCPEDVLCAPHVDVVKILAAPSRRGRGEVIDEIAPVERFAQGPGVPDVHLDRCDAPGRPFPAPSLKAADAVPPGRQMEAQMPSDEAATSGHSDLHEGSPS
jgi:hypothetical protein